MSRVLLAAGCLVAAWLLVAAAILAPFSMLWIPGALLAAGVYLNRTSPTRTAQRRARRRKGYIHHAR